MIILGISAFYHDSAAAIIINGEIIAAAQEERFTRIKHDPAFPSKAIQYCLKEAGINLSEIQIVAFYDKPFLKFERLLETYYGYSPKGLKSFIRSVPIWVKEKLFLKSHIKKQLQQIGNIDTKKLTLLFPEHHLSHAASAYYPSPFQESAILTIDGVGEWATASICHGTDHKIKIVKELKFPHSLGLLYSAFTYFLGFKVNSGEYKMMGLAPYGNSNSADYTNYIQIIKKHLITICEDGSIRLNQSYFSYATGDRMVYDHKWAKLFNIKRREPSEEINQQHMDLALAIQHITEEVVISMAKEAKRITGSSNLCLAGGVALNCVANGKLQEAGVFDNMWIQPAAGDAGGSLGAALAAHHIYNSELLPIKNGDNMKGSYLGPDYHDCEVAEMAKRYKAPYIHYQNLDQLTSKVAKILASDNVVGWFQGRMEFGPRALGHRSIIGDARSKTMQAKLNLKIKYRESFRPFAPSILAEDASEYFDMQGDSPYMLLVKDLQEKRKIELPQNYNELPLMDKLRCFRSDIPAVTHVDNSGRIQTVNGNHNKEYHALIKAFKDLTGYGIVINTSFNVRGEPIVCTPEDAYRCFMRTDMDYLVVNGFVFDKKSQPDWKNKDNWQEEFTLD